MGTNFYVETNDPCEECRGSGKRRQHIGKSSGGWLFLFNPFRQSFREWMLFLKEGNKKIWDEYGEPMTAAELETFIVEKQKTDATHWQSHERPGEHETRDSEGYRISKHEDFS